MGKAMLVSVVGLAVGLLFAAVLIGLGGIAVRDWPIKSAVQDTMLEVQKVAESNRGWVLEEDYEGRWPKAARMHVEMPAGDSGLIRQVLYDNRYRVDGEVVRETEIDDGIVMMVSLARNPNWIEEGRLGWFEAEMRIIWAVSAGFGLLAGIVCAFIANQEVDRKRLGLT